MSAPAKTAAAEHDALNGLAEFRDAREKAAEALQQLNRRKGGARAPTKPDSLYLSVATKKGLPETLFWDPFVLTDEQGRATIKLQLPPTDARYRLRIDAHAPGRLGFLEQPIVISRSAAETDR
jgi:hypothetical protein